MATTPTQQEQAVIDVNQRRVDALVAGDLDRLATHVGEDLVYVSPTGTAQSRAEVFAAFRSGELRIECQDLREVGVRIHGDTAIAGYLSDSVTWHRGERLQATMRCTSVYVHRDGRWQLVLQHNSVVA